MSHLRTLLVVLLGSAMLPFSASADPLEVGTAAPTLTSTTDAGKSLDLATVYKSNRYTLVYFYPKADTPGCTKQGCSLRDAYADLTSKGVAIIGVSADSVEAQKAFKEKYNLPFTLLADKEMKVITAFGAKNALLPMSKRQAYLIKDGKIVYADHSGSTTKQAEDILNFLAKSGS
ncbi:MAG: peroxiredoxin [Opitutaceae bacterium]